MNENNATNPAEAYHDYLGPALFAPCADRMADEAGPRDGETAVDIACGTGILTRRLLPGLGERGRITGIDISPDMLAVARQHTPTDLSSVNWREAAADSLPMDDASVDLVVCQQGFQFFPDRAAAAREMRRVLNGNGRAVVAVWHSLEQHPVFRALMEAEASHLGVPLETLAVPFSGGDDRALEDTFAEAGFARVRVETATFPADFPDPDRFIEMTVMAGAAVIPDLVQEGPEARAALVDAVARDAAETVQHYRQGGWLRFPMHTWIVSATTF
jgi:SAM-dependent methyltransferase